MHSSARFIPAAWLIAGLTLGSRILGLLRECAFGYFLSTSELLSAFRIAFMAPNLARRLFGEGALSSAMIPILTEHIQTQGEQASRRFVGSLLTCLAAVLIAAVVVLEGVILLWRGVHDDPALELATILMPYMALICTVAVASAVLNVRRHFATPAAAPMILNLGLIAATVGGAVWARLDGIPLMYVICGGVLVAGVAQLVAVGVALRAVSFFPVFGRARGDPKIRAVVTLMGPMILGLSAVQINSLVDYLIAYLLVTVDGVRVGPAVLGYAQYLYQLPLGVFGIAIATAVFPVLSQRASEGNREGLAETFARGLRLSLFVALPASVGLLFVAEPLVASLFERGEFDAADTQRVAGTLFFYSMGMVAYFAQHILARTFYALKDSRTPARVALWMVGLNFVMNLVLVLLMQERGLALGTAICALIQVVWLSRRFAATLPEIGWRPIGGAVLRMAAATGMMALVLGAIKWLSTSSEHLAQWVVPELVLLVLCGVITYAVSARLLGIEELGTVRHLRGRAER